MRHPCSTATPAVVRTWVTRELARIVPLPAVGRRLTPGRVYDALWLVAALRASLSAVARRFALGCSHETLRRAVRSHLPPADALAEAVVDGLHRSVPRPPRKGFRVAIDTHFAPFYGRPGTPGTVGGPKKAGTHRFFAYATAVVVEKGRRYTVGLAPVATNRPEAAVDPLLDQLAARGVRVRCLVLDRAFFAVRVVERLERDRVPYVIGVPKKGAAIRRLSARPAGATLAYTLTSRDRRRRVPVRLVVARRRVRGGRRVAEVYAYRRCDALRARHGAALAAAACRRYAARFGIEASYRQMNQAKGRTTAADRSWRLLLVGLGLLLRQVWVALTAAGRGWNPAAALERLRDRLADALRALYTETDPLPINPRRLNAYGRPPGC